MALLQEIPVPLLAVNDTTLSVVELPFGAGTKVKKGDVILVLETSKTSYDVEAETEGYIQYHCEAGRDYAVGDIIAKIFSEASEAVSPVAAAPRASQPQVIPPTNGHKPVAPRPISSSRRQAQGSWAGEPVFSHEAHRLMTAAGIGPEAFAGHDLVTGADVRELLEPTAKPAPKTTIPQAPPNAVIQRLQSAKRREIEYLSDIQSTGLTSTINTNVDTEGIFIHLNTALAYLKDSLLPVILYESARLLVDYPLLNAYFTGDAVAIYKEVNPGFAIDIDKGLKVLKVKDAGIKSIRDIEKDILQLSGAYLDDAVQVADLTDITFTITDLSAEGVASFRPLINRMNSSILGVSAIDEKLQRCTLSLTFDHRVTEGKYAAGFLRELQQRLESYKGDAGSRYKDISCFKCYKTLGEDLGGTGFVRCITPEGKEGYVCQSCLKGY
ncbi:MAG TPA: 2-oxo acid dehydrogenase subunit E2 [Puia sp.]|uniref:2-oxo acid dehydrogenase subunit E2 n=1 Tax=Puia sp. TaxID=2045100 RepID=UPI002BCAA637|nr:2-oxo acid dehydrogenase subunit E2 [Puia sp.]HVU98952.1 2-oxo acid dehydrogenase subunit E2 [Puia sp.]